MTRLSIRSFSAVILASCCFLSPLAAETRLTVKDTKGRSIGIDLVAFVNETVIFRRQGDAKEFSLPIGNFDESSQALIRKEAADLPAPMPKLKPEVIVGKRAVKASGSFYMEKQTVTCTVKISNLDLKMPTPELKGKVIFIGQERRRPDEFSILSAQSFDVTVPATETIVKELEPFSTSYDSDNKGEGNVGGYRYDAYILALTDAEGNIVLHETSSAIVRQSFEEKPSRLKELLGFTAGKKLSAKMIP